MTATIHYYRYIPETNRDVLDRTETKHEGMVLASGNGWYHVPSDNAMIDSGTTVWWEVWTGYRVERHEIVTGRGGISVSATIDASPADKEKADAYRAALSVAKDIERAFSDHTLHVADANKVKTGCKVEVFKGRKVPKGVYFVRSMGEGNYGPYLDLSNTDKPGVGSKLYTYISLDNCRVIDAALPPLPYSKTVQELARAAIGSPFSYPPVPEDVTAYAPLVDALEEEGKQEEADKVRAYVDLVLTTAVIA